MLFNPQLTLLVGLQTIGYAFVPLPLVLQPVMRSYWQPVHQGGKMNGDRIRGFRQFPLPRLKWDSELTFDKHSLFLVSASHCRSVVPYVCGQLPAFLPCYFPVSAFAFRLGRLSAALPCGVVPYATSNNALSGRTPLKSMTSITPSATMTRSPVPKPSGTYSL